MKVIILFFITALPIIAPSQLLDTLDASRVTVAEIGFNSSLNSVRKKLGAPVGYHIYQEEEGEEEGAEQWFYFTYDSLKLAFSQWNEEVHLSSFSVTGKQYAVVLGEISLSVGDEVEVLKNHFPYSFEDFALRKWSSLDKENKFYVRIAVAYHDVISYDGIVNIKVNGKRITEISVSFQPA